MIHINDRIRLHKIKTIFLKKLHILTWLRVINNNENVWLFYNMGMEEGLIQSWLLLLKIQNEWLFFLLPSNKLKPRLSETRKILEDLILFVCLGFFLSLFPALIIFLWPLNTDLCEWLKEMRNINLLLFLTC